MRKVASEGLRAFIVWMPVLDSDDRASAARLAARERDARASHFWAPSRAIGETFAQPFPPRGIPLAWDVVMLFDRGARWARGALPVPKLVRYPEGMAPEGEAAFDEAELRSAVEDALAARGTRPEGEGT
jgi:hypothetical protein